jgi:phosphatidylethanolamine/phosphatidyl-N-methylethanolamine N-methyltransferase
VTTGFVTAVYAKLSPVYDLLFGRILQPGRVATVARMDLNHGASVLEVGVGTGLNAPLYPAHLRVTGIDISADMLEKARERVAREHLDHVRLVQMDAAHLTFPDNAFDIVYAPYTISVVPDAVRVAREMRRVCKVGGTILLLNHFLSANPLLASVERAICPWTVHAGFRSDVDLQDVLASADLTPTSIDEMNSPPLWRLVTCPKVL